MDERLRSLERRAATGDPDAMGALARARERLPATPPNTGLLWLGEGAISRRAVHAQRTTATGWCGLPLRGFAQHLGTTEQRCSPMHVHELHGRIGRRCRRCLDLVPLRCWSGALPGQFPSVFCSAPDQDHALYILASGLEHAPTEGDLSGLEVRALEPEDRFNMAGAPIKAQDYAERFRYALWSTWPFVPACMPMTPRVSPKRETEWLRAGRPPRVHEWALLRKARMVQDPYYVHEWRCRGCGITISLWEGYDEVPQ